jgi:hypothetical protein
MTFMTELLNLVDGDAIEVGHFPTFTSMSNKNLANRQRSPKSGQESERHLQSWVNGGMTTGEDQTQSIVFDLRGGPPPTPPLSVHEATRSPRPKLRDGQLFFVPFRVFRGCLPAFATTTVAAMVGQRIVVNPGRSWAVVSDLPD